MDLLLPLNLPPYPFKISSQNGQLFLFDEIRKKEVVLTPEEWVRQHFVQYLIKEKNYPRSLIKLEGGLKLNGQARRSDIVIFNNKGEKILLVECKAPAVKVTQQVFDQVARYNWVHRVPLIAVTNGLQHYYCKIDFVEQRYDFIVDIASYESTQSTL
ncbi:type I restriction enzyme HsdR N-terminal domain-containing protein [Mucilaginibacter paludis]|uniref:Restriction endonuclease, type I, EcoRI, R subunit/Type III n=1 Tax=Mucilaginibacter paludis DSM 18603 TaxID=714943 RepID=H1Y5E9_9SPHI|nr:type I restriction enzyme HsdR N-terminal domain-containing protein [Mucilaginibacter paludis]EHQ28960.1 Restriction endonuclease, type I, EcoRI, R subunit/Type III [Mucilaginibacter paludis DSM 18603]